MEPRMAYQPRFDLRVLMGSIIVYDKMQVQLSRSLLINECEKLDPLLVAMAVHARSNDVPLGHLQGSEQGGRSIAFVVVGHGSQAPLDQWQSWLGSVQRLNRCFLISTHYQRVLGRVQIQAHHIDNFFNKLLVSADFERLGQMRLRPLAFHTRCTIDLSMPSVSANVRMLQCVLLAGLLWVVVLMIKGVMRSRFFGFRPPRGRSFSIPANRFWINLRRHRDTWRWSIPKSSAIVLSCSPAAAINTILARFVKRVGVRRPRDQPVSVLTSLSTNSIDGAFRMELPS